MMEARFVLHNWVVSHLQFFVFQLVGSADHHVIILQDFKQAVQLAEKSPSRKGIESHSENPIHYDSRSLWLPWPQLNHLDMFGMIQQLIM